MQWWLLSECRSTRCDMLVHCTLYIVHCTLCITLITQLGIVLQLRPCYVRALITKDCATMSTERDYKTMIM